MPVNIYSNCVWAKMWISFLLLQILKYVNDESIFTAGRHNLDCDAVSFSALNTKSISTQWIIREHDNELTTIRLVMISLKTRVVLYDYESIIMFRHGHGSLLFSSLKFILKL